MRKVLLIIALPILCTLSLLAQEEVYKNDEVTVFKLKDHVWVFDTYDFTNMYLVEGEDRAMLIDTGTKCQDLDKIVRSLSSKPLVVVVTHAHPDHAGCIGYFDRVWMHQADSVLIPNYSKDFQGEIQYMEEGQVFDLGGTQLEVALMPGHTPGSIVLLDKAHGDCYSGDAFGSGEVWLQCVPTSPISVYYESCVRMEKKMDEYGIKDIWCGHWHYLKRPLTLEYIQTMQRIAARLMNGDQEGATPYPHPYVKMAESVRRLTEGPVCIVYDSSEIH